ncbi:hypothetical protein K432DRAFT_445884 [Lepidopterella palustris CBS 459.81]|uniref:Flap structure-specific endonuclease n=1 Tax=Lepidopterella palustris CBS 459.81 TaxID=1314670 RepID=A0A8E2JBM8_9PEZI|nr:hypothetical protein K432DRAFT_445884 [Lepidopterella palustris CBS 459.81]
MGIQGIYKEIGPGERIALSKLAAEKFEQTGRPLRIAIDISIWLFQIQSSKGGTNPALRTFYYRLLRLISLSIHPIFVFDGPNKPPFKRNKRTGHNVASIPEFLAKQLLKQFGFPMHLAPGEAEAECALLQREGIVDAVLSEDVDTLMFGSGITLRNWSPEAKASKNPTHVNLYDAAKTKSGQSGLDREGMILVALMSGGDYIPEGIPGCGPKTACEAARAGFGSDLCKIAKNDTKALQEWRERLAHELRTNESKYFKRRHAALVIPEDFPRTDILGYYTHPAISSNNGLDKLRRSLKWDQDLDFPGLREFTGDAFDWMKLSGAKKFIRNLAPALLVRHLRMRGDGSIPISDDPEVIQQEEAKLVKSIHGKRTHATTDNSTELRLAFIPIELVNIDLGQEEPDDEVPEDDSEEEMQLPLETGDSGEDVASAPKRGPSTYDPTKIEKVWILETFVRVGVPLKVQDWEEAFRNPKKLTMTKTANKTATKVSKAKKKNTTGGMPKGALDRFTKVTKPGVILSQATQKVKDTCNDPIEKSSMAVSRAIPPPSSFRMPPPLLESPNRHRQQDIISLRSSPTSRKANTTTVQPTVVNAPPLIAEDAPPTVTKRRRRTPLQRSHTLPADILSQQHSTTPPPSGFCEELSLLSSPELPSPSGLVKRAKTAVPVGRSSSTQRFPSRAPRHDSTPLPVSPLTFRFPQPPLYNWLTRSPSTTPTAARQANSSSTTDPNPDPLHIQSLPNSPEHRDLTHSPPPCAPAAAKQPAAFRPTRPATARAAMASISGNSNGNGSNRSTYFKDTSASFHSPSPVSPYHRKPIATPPADLPAPRCSPPTAEHLDLTVSSPAFALTHAIPSSHRIPSEHTNTNQPLPSKPPPSLPAPHTLRRSPRQHKSPPPALWKAQKTKNRAIALRESLEGSWKFIDEIDLTESPEQGMPNAGGLSGGFNGRRVEREWQRRVGMVSQIEEIDLTGD